MGNIPAGIGAGNEVVVLNGLSLCARSQVNMKNVAYLYAICGFPSHLLHALLFLLESAMLAVSSQPAARPPQECVCSCVCVCLCVCLRKWCSTSLCKFPSNRAKISSVKRPRQPFGRHAPCCPRVFSRMEPRTLVVWQPLMWFCGFKSHRF